MHPTRKLALEPNQLGRFTGPLEIDGLANEIAFADLDAGVAHIS